MAEAPINDNLFDPKRDYKEYLELVQAKLMEIIIHVPEATVLPIDKFEWDENSEDELNQILDIYIIWATKLKEVLINTRKDLLYHGVTYGIDDLDHSTELSKKLLSVAVQNNSSFFKYEIEQNRYFISSETASKLLILTTTLHDLNYCFSGFSIDEQTANLMQSQELDLDATELSEMIELFNVDDENKYPDEYKSIAIGLALLFRYKPKNKNIHKIIEHVIINDIEATSLPIIFSQPQRLAEIFKRSETATLIALFDVFYANIIHNLRYFAECYYSDQAPINLKKQVRQIVNGNEPVESWIKSQLNFFVALEDKLSGALEMAKANIEGRTIPNSLWTNHYVEIQTHDLSIIKRYTDLIREIEDKINYFYSISEDDSWENALKELIEKIKSEDLEQIIIYLDTM